MIYKVISTTINKPNTKELVSTENRIFQNDYSEFEKASLEAYFEVINSKDFQIASQIAESSSFKLSENSFLPENKEIAKVFLQLIYNFVIE